MSLLHSPRFQRWARRHQLCRVDGIEDRFALTFDDGPSPRNTPRLLEVLARHGARATFFVLAARVRRHPELVRRAIGEGHEVGIHGDLHLPAFLLPAPLLLRDVRVAEAALFAAAGVRTRFYRPPFGLVTPAQARVLRESGYEPVLGDVYPADSPTPRRDRIVRQALPRLRAGSILILHDSSVARDPDRGATIEAVEIILPEMARRGILAGSVGDLTRRAGQAPKDR